MVKVLLQQPIFRRLIYVCCGVLMIFCFGLAPNRQVWSAEPSAIAAANPNAAIQCKMSAYLMRLNEFKFAEGTFSADTWINANCNKNKAIDLKSLDFTTAQNYQVINSNEEQIGNVFYTSADIEGSFYQQWNLENYPFDRHVLKIPFELSDNTDAAGFAFVADKEHSAIHPQVILEDGWKITNFNIEGSSTKYISNFADPTATKNELFSPKLTIAFDLQRVSYLSFIKLTTGVYIAFAICMICTLLNVADGGIYSSSLSIIVGCLFAVFVNLQVAQSVLGDTEGLTMVDEIHIATMLFILLIGLGQSIFHYLYSKKDQKNLQKKERRTYSVLAIIYAVINTVLIVGARLAG
jgi:hypothetical protein